MRILLVTEGTYPYVIGGVSTWCDQLITSLDEHQFSLLSVVGPEPKEPSFSRPKNVEQLTVVPLWKPREGLLPANYAQRQAFDKAFFKFTGFIDGNLGGLGQGLLELAKLGDHFDLWPLFERKNIWEALAKKLAPHLPYTPRLAELALTANWLRSALVPLLFTPAKTDIVHTVVNGLAALPAWTASKVHGVPLILTEHGIYLRERYLAFSEEKDPAALKYLRTSLYQSLARLVYVHADKVLSVSEFNRKWQHEFGAPLGRTQVIANGVKPEAFPEARSKAQAEPTVVWIGRIDPLKDVETLIHAFRKLVPRLPKARLKLFGPVPKGNEAYLMRIASLIEDLGLENNISIEGSISPAHLAYHQADVVALSSISEGFPYTIIEAMMCARAVVATRVGGVPEVLGDTGVVVPAQAYEEMANAFFELLTNPDKRNQLGAHARRRALSYFTLDKVITAYNRVYHDVVSPIIYDFDDPVLLITHHDEDEQPILLRDEENR